ncbi:MAG TPA: BLUF domain-containing protein [Lysobacter sp.]|nr:BLUF domain-containing protein [Lysobacter sp.]
MIDALLYESRADERLSDAELEVILIGSRVRNARRGITGALLRDRDRIVQYLEGEPAAIERTLAAIDASPLHHDLAVIERASGIERAFDRWHMGFRGFHADHRRAASTGEWVDSLAAVRGRTAGNPALARLIALWDEFGGD